MILTNNFGNDTVETFRAWLDRVISARLPDPTKKPKLFELFKTYHRYKYSKLLRKYKNTACRFYFGRYFGEKSITAKSLPVSLKEQADIMASRKK